MFACTMWDGEQQNKALLTNTSHTTFRHWLQGMAELQRLAAPTVFSFTAIFFREVLMDMADMEGGC